MIKFDKNEFLEPMIYSTNDEDETRCRVKKEIVDDIKNLQQRINKTIEILNKYKKLCESKLNFEKNTHSPTARHNEMYWKDCIDKLNYILSILHDEKEK